MMSLSKSHPMYTGSKDINQSEDEKMRLAGKRKMNSVSFDMGMLQMNSNPFKQAVQLFKGHLAESPPPSNILEKFCCQIEDNKEAINKTDPCFQYKQKSNQNVIDSLVFSKDKKSCKMGTTEGVKEKDWTTFENTYAKDLTLDDDDSSQAVCFLTEIVDLLLDYVRRMNDRSTKVLDFHHPHQLKEALGHCLDIPNTPRDLEQVLSDCKETLKYGVKTGHPHYFNQLSSGLDIIALAGEWVTATANTNLFTYEIAPVFTLMEEVTLQKMCEHVGWIDGDGIFAPGGAISNLYAVLAARYVAFPETKEKGMGAIADTLVLYTSEQAHYSIKRAAAITGIGTDNVVLLKCDDRGKIIPAQLVKAIAETRSEGKVPFMVSATGGSTVLGAFDPIDEMADICANEKIWFHVDCAWGGGVLLSPNHRHLIKGIEKADSVTWNPHKAMGVTLQCSAILLKQKGILAACNSMNAGYLFQKDKQYDTSYDTGDKTIQCGRHNDVFKLWLMWRAKGDQGFRSQIEKLFKLSEYLQEQLKLRPGFKFVLKNPEYLNVCFWYIPQKLRSHAPGLSFETKINKVAPRIKAMMMEAGSTMVGYQPLGNKPNFFRMIVSNQSIRTEDIDFLLDEIVKFGEEIDI